MSFTEFIQDSELFLLLLQKHMLNIKHFTPRNHYFSIATFPYMVQQDTVNSFESNTYIFLN